MPVNLKALAKMFKKHGKDDFIVNRSEGFAYVTNGEVMVQLPTRDLRDVLAIHPEVFEKDGAFRKGIYYPEPPDITKVWRDFSNDPDLKDAEDTRLSLEGLGEDRRILALPDCYVTVNAEYFAPFKNCRLKGTGPSKPIVVYDAEEPIAIIMPIKYNELPKWIKSPCSTLLEKE